MSTNDKLEELSIKLFDINAVKFGEFITKSGIKTPVYFDLRVIVSYPDVMELISSLLYEFAVKDNDCDHLCGVPYTALPIATLISVLSKKPMLMRRKEAKSYGTKKMIEGHYKDGQSCLIIEDVVTSGSSVLETANDLRKEGLIVNEAVVILNREQGGLDYLKTNNIKLMSLLTMGQLIDVLLKNGKITDDIAVDVKNYLKETRAPAIKEAVNRTVIPFEKRADIATNDIARTLYNIMATKQSNLCLSVDLTSTTQILNLLESVGEHICLVKTHVDILEDFNEDFVIKLKELSRKFNFLILEDRKFADIGNTVSLQYTKGLYKIAEWADIVTVHLLPGEGILKGLQSSSKGHACGVFLIAEMSSEDNLFTKDYIETTVRMAEKYSEIVVGFVCQNGAIFDNPGFIQLTPGVQLESSTDGLGQIYNTPETIILAKGADIAVVGRGIIAAKNPEAQAVIYKENLWECYLKRISNK